MPGRRDAESQGTGKSRGASGISVFQLRQEQWLSFPAERKSEDVLPPLALQLCFFVAEGSQWEMER